MTSWRFALDLEVIFRLLFDIVTIKIGILISQKFLMGVREFLHRVLNLIQGHRIFILEVPDICDHLWYLKFLVLRDLGILLSLLRPLQLNIVLIHAIEAV